MDIVPRCTDGCPILHIDAVSLMVDVRVGYSHQWCRLIATSSHSVTCLGIED